MNLLFLTYQGDMAGSTNSIAYLSKGLAERGHRVVLGCREESLLYQLVANSQVIRYPMTFKSKWSRESLQQIKKAVEDFDIQLINAQSSKDRYLSIFSKWRYKLPVKIIHTRRQTPKSVGGFLQNWFYVKGTDKIVTVSEQLKNTFIQKGIPAKHLHVIYNGIPKEKYQQFSEERVLALREQFGIQTSDMVIGSIARLKKQEQIIRALPYLDKKIKVLFVGFEAGVFDELVAELGIENEIIYAGKVDGKDIMNYYPLLDVQILPSTMDGFGLVLVEAMGMSVPVIGTRYEGIIDVLDNQQNGLWFEDGNVEELATKIKQVLYEKPVREKLIANGLKAAHERFTLEQTILNYERFFQEIIDNGK
ncbi:MAG: glycosyltransferase family 4 protein [Bacteroidota bacterium]